MTEGSVDTIVSAIYLMMEGHGKNKGLDFAEVVRQFLLDLTVPEQRQFWSELKGLYQQKWPNNSTEINPQDNTSWIEQLKGKDATAGGLQ